MMKIHTTQNLKVSVTNHQSTNAVLSKDIRFNYLQEQPATQGNIDNVSFKAKPKINPEAIKEGKKFVSNITKKLGDLKRNPEPEKSKWDKFLNSKTFKNMLDLANYDVVLQGAISAIICLVLRPLTIMALPDKDGKQNNMYASAHSMASGTVGLFASIILTTPFKKGADFVWKEAFNSLTPKTLKRLFPHLDEKTLVHKDVNKLKDVYGNKFSTEIKNCAKLPEGKFFADCSETTLNEHLLKKNGGKPPVITWSMHKGSFNDVKLGDKKLYDMIDWSRVGIVVEESGMPKSEILLKNLDKEFLEQIIKDAPEMESEALSNWKNLDIKSVYKKCANGKWEMQDPSVWKRLDNGQQWLLDLDTLHLLSPLETANYRPLITGAKVYDEKENIWKYQTHQNNGEGDKLGTAITKEMLEAESTNHVLVKLLTWIPDFLTRVPVAMGTIALIPWFLKTVFHLEKNKKPVENKIQEPKVDVNSVNANKQGSVQPAFKGRNNDVTFNGNKPTWFTKLFAKAYGKPLLEKEGIYNISKKMSNLPGEFTQHMATVGSVLTTGVYMQQTLTKKELDPDRRRTLAFNQLLNCIVPTIAAYTANHWIEKDITKPLEYRFSGLQNYKNAMQQAGKKVDGIVYDHAEMGKKLRGVRTLGSLATFTLFYRYLTPVVITPIANWIGDKINTRRHEKEAQAAKAQTAKA